MKKSFLKLAFLFIILLMVVNTASAVSDADMQLLGQSSDDVSISVIDSTIGSNDVSVNAIDLNLSAGSEDSSKDISVRDIDSNLGSGSNVVSNEDDSIISLGDPEKVTPTDTGASIYFDNGYFGFCVDEGLDPANPSNTFTVHNSSILSNNLNSAPIGDYLKILVYDYYHDYMKGDIEEFWAFGSQVMVWFFSDLDFKDPAVIDEYSPDPIIIHDIIDKYDAGMRVPDHNAVKKINDTDYLIFDFIALVPDSGDVQTYFAFKVNSSHIDVNKTSNVTDGSKIYKGDNLTYTIVVNNTNDFDMTCDVTDELPEGLEFVGASGDYDYDPSTRTIVWHIPNTAGETVNLEVYVTVTASNATIVESVVVSNKTYNITVGNNTTDIVEPVANITIIKEVDKKSINICDDVTWTIVVTNHGPDGAENVTVTDVLPSEFIEFVSATPSVGTFDKDTGLWTIGNLGKDESVNLVIVTKVIVANVTVINTATVISPTPAYDENGTINPNGTNKTATNDTFAEEIPDPILPSVNKTSNATGKIYKGDDLTYTIEVKNNENYGMNYIVTDELPKELEFIDASGVYSYDESTHTIVWHIYTIAYETVTLHVYTKVIVSNATIVETVNVTDGNYGRQVTNNTTDVVEPVANITITKYTFDKVVYYGDNVTWFISVTNHGPDGAENVTVTDVIPSDLLLISATPNKGIFNIVDGVWTIGDLGKDESVTLTLVTKAIEDNVTIVNNATVISPTPAYDENGTINPNGTNKTSSDYTEVLPIHDPHVTKTSNATGKIYKGDNLTYTITFTNHNDVNVTYIVIDELPDEVEFVGASGDYSYNSGNRTVVWNIDTTANETVTLYVYVKVIVSNDTIVQIVHVHNDTHDVDVDVNTTDYVEPVANITIIKEVDKKSIIYGEEVTWTIVVTNHGPDCAENVTVTDIIPTDLLELISATPSVGTFNIVDGVWTIGDLANTQSVTLTLVTKAIVPNVTVINTATVITPTPSYDEDGNITNTTNKTATNDTSVKDIKDPNVTKISNATGKVYKGDDLTYTIEVKNNNDYDMSYVVVDELPDGLDFVGASGDYSYNGSARTIIWNIDTTAGETVTLYVYAKVAVSNATIVESVVVSNETFNITVGNNTTDVVEPVVNITIIKYTFDKTVVYGENVKWFIIVTNLGPDVAENVTVTDLIPSELELVNVTTPFGHTWDNNGTWYIGNLNPNQISVLTFITKAIVPNVTVINTATVISPTPAYDENGTINPNGTNKTSSDYTEVLPIYNPNVNKTSNATGKVYKGDNLTYTIEVKNNNEYNVTYIVTDELPDGLDFVGASGNYSYDEDSRTIVWHIPTTANETVTLEVYVKVIVSNATIVESVVVSNETYNITVGNNTTDYVEPIVDLSVIKDVSVNKIKVGDKVVYTIVVLNNGPDVANNVIVKELLPSGVKFVSASVNKGIYNEATGVWTINTLNNGESATLKITVIATKEGIITNFVDVTCDEFDLDHSNNNDSVDIIVSTNNNTNSTNNTHGVINNHGIPMEHTGNPILVLLIMFVVFGTGLLRREK